MDAKTKIKNLPPDIRKLLADDDLVAAIFVLAEEMKISDLQALEIEDRTVRMLAGDLHPSKFVSELASAGLTQEKASSIARTITTEIVSGVESSIKELYHISGPLSNVLQRATPQPQTLTVPRPPAPAQKAPGIQESATVVPAKTFEKDIERAKSGLPPAPMVTPPVRIERPEMPRSNISVPPKPPTNLPGSLRPPTISSGKTGPSDAEPTPENIYAPKNAFEEKLQRTVGGAQGGGTQIPSSSKDPYREPLA